MNIISLSNNLDLINRTSNNIPENFNWKIYTAIVKNNSLYNINLAYNHYLQYGQYNPNIYKLFWRTVYDIPHNFNEESYQKYLEEKCKVYLTFKKNEDLYKFYCYTGKKLYPLNDQYSRIHFNIPDNFDDKIYVSLYPEAQSKNINMVYNFYNLNKTNYPLNEKYFTLFYNNISYNPQNKTVNEIKIPYNNHEEFNFNIVNQYDKININGNNNITNDMIHNNNKNNNDNNYDNNIANDIINNDITHNDNINNDMSHNDNINNDISHNDNINNDISHNDNINNAMSHNVNTNVNNDLNIELFIDIDKINFNYKIFNKRYNLNLNEIDTIHFYKTKFKEYPLDELYHKYFYNIPDNFNETHLFNFKILFNINNKNTVDTYKYYRNIVNTINNGELKNDENYINFLYIEEFIDKNIIFYNEVFLYGFINGKIKLEYIYNIYLVNSNSNEGIKFLEHYNYLNNYNYLCTDFLKKKYFLLKSFINEYFNDNSMNIFSNFNYNNNLLFVNLAKWETFFELYIKQNYYLNLFKNLKLSKQTNNEIEFICCIFDNYTHNYISFMESLTILKYNYKITIFTTFSISESNRFKKYFNVFSVIPNITIKIYENSFSYKEFNMTISQINFWEQINSNYVILFNPLVILKTDIFNELTSKNHYFIYLNDKFNKCINFNFTIKNKSKMIDIIKIFKEDNYSLNKNIDEYIISERFNLDFHDNVTIFLFEEENFVKYLD